MSRESLIEGQVTGLSGVVSAHIAEIVDGLPGSHALVVQLQLDAAAAANPGPPVRLALEAVWWARGGRIRSGRLRVWTLRSDGLRVDLRPAAVIEAAGLLGADSAGDDVLLAQGWLRTLFGAV